MPTREETVKDPRVLIKDCWHPYGLQALSPEKFIAVTSLILQGKFNLLQLPHKETATTGRA